VRSGKARDLLGERDPGAAGLAASQPAHQQPDHHWPSGKGGVSQPAMVGAVHPTRFDAAAWTRHLVPPGSGFDHDPAVSLVESVDRDLCQVRQQPLKIAPRSAITVHTGH
jgi:hypothetical protein